MLSIKFVKRILISLLYLLSFLALTGCASKLGRFGIVFTNGFTDIYRIPDNTQSKVEQLTFTPTIGEYQLLVSNNGDKIVFQAGQTSLDENLSEATVETPRHIYLLDTNSGIFVDITNMLVKYAQVWQTFNMDWSPDEKQFVIVGHSGSNFEIESFLELVDIDGENKKNIYIPTTGEISSLIQSAEWSPDGKKFVLTQGVIGLEQQLQNPSSAILVYDLKSRNLVQITDYKDHCFPRAWSPTSKQIVATCSFFIPYVEGVSGPRTVRIFDVENPGQPYERIAFSPCQDPSWSPDGKQIAFACDKDKDHMGLFIANSDGNGIHEIDLGDLENPAILKTPIWSPDGSQIIYTAGHDVNSQDIYSIHLDNSENHVLTEQSGYYQIVSVYPVP